MEKTPPFGWGLWRYAVSSCRSKGPPKGRGSKFFASIVSDSIPLSPSETLQRVDTGDRFAHLANPSTSDVMPLTLA